MKAIAAVLAAILATTAAPAAAVEITPFQIRNGSPLVQIFGLPATGDPFVVQQGKGEVGLSLNAASNFAKDSNANEQILLDGETYRYALSLKYGLFPGLEAGVEIPYYQYGGGFMDGFIIGWHDTFQMSQGGRDRAPKNRYLYQYTRDGQTRLYRDNSGNALGDISLSAGYQLLKTEGDAPAAVALRASLKLPTGSSGELTGSGSTDFSLSLAGGKKFVTPIGGAEIYGDFGGLALTTGDVLRDQQRHLVAFGSLGGGWSPFSVLALKVELDAHTPFYTGSDLRVLSMSSAQLVVGGTVALGETTTLDLGVSEDVVVKTAPDVMFHINLRKRF